MTFYQAFQFIDIVVSDGKASVAWKPTIWSVSVYFSSYSWQWWSSTRIVSDRKRFGLYVNKFRSIKCLFWNKMYWFDFFIVSETTVMILIIFTQVEIWNHSQQIKLLCCYHKTEKWCLIDPCKHSFYTQRHRVPFYSVTIHRITLYSEKISTVLLALTLKVWDNARLSTSRQPWPVIAAYPWTLLIES